MTHPSRTRLAERLRAVRAPRFRSGSALARHLGWQQSKVSRIELGLQEGRHDLARHVFHGRRGDLRQAYQQGMEDQLGALGLVLNCITLWNTVYLDAALAALRAKGHPVLDADAVRLSPYMRRHLNVHGHYTFTLPELAGARRALRDPDAGDEDSDNA